MGGQHADFECGQPAVQPNLFDLDCGVGCFANCDRRTPGVAFGQNRGVQPTNSQLEPAKPKSLFLPFDGRILPETRLSDHASFWDAGLPALMVTDTAFFRNPNYHLPSDTIDTLNFTFMAELVKSLELALLELPPAPT